MVSAVSADTCLEGGVAKHGSIPKTHGYKLWSGYCVRQVYQLPFAYALTVLLVLVLPLFLSGLSRNTQKISQAGEE